jgi:hypothetical protein
MKDITPSPSEIEASKTPKGGWTKQQLALWGVEWPPVKGWKRRLIQRWHEDQKQKQKPERRNMTIEQEWQRYKARVYPGGLSRIQHDETRKAFMAGAGVMFVTMMNNAKLPMDEAMDATKATENDLLKELTAYSTKPEARN